MELNCKHNYNNYNIIGIEGRYVDNIYMYCMSRIHTEVLETSISHKQKKT